MIHQPNASTGGHHIILITNLENNLSPSIIEQFIHKHTSILPEVLVFPSQSSVPYASGAICLDSETKLEKIFKFLLNSEHMIISARGRYQLFFLLLCSLHSLSTRNLNKCKLLREHCLKAWFVDLPALFLHTDHGSLLGRCLTNPICGFAY